MDDGAESFNGCKLVIVIGRRHSCDSVVDCLYRMEEFVCSGWFRRGQVVVPEFDCVTYHDGSRMCVEDPAATIVNQGWDNIIPLMASVLPRSAY
jgi:hypothetical protein